MLNRLAWKPGDALLSLKYDLSLYAFTAAAVALLVFLVLFRRKAFGGWLAAVVVAVFGS